MAASTYREADRLLPGLDIDAMVANCINLGMTIPAALYELLKPQSVRHEESVRKTRSSDIPTWAWSVDHRDRQQH